MATDDRATLLAMMKRHGISQFQYQDDVQTITLSLGRRPVSTVRSPAQGQFTRTHPMSSPANKPASLVAKDGIAGYLKIGPLLRPVTTGSECQILETKVSDGTLVGYSDALYDRI